MNRILLMIGALQGWALWGLWKAREIKSWPSMDPISERMLLYVSLALPFAYYLSENLTLPTKRRRVALLMGVGVLFACLGAYSGWADYTPMEVLGSEWNFPPVRPSDLMAAGILGFILIPLFAHYEGPTTRWSYHALFETAWRNGLMFSYAGLMTGAFWVVLYAGAMLMKSIGLHFVEELIEKSIFAIPVTGIAFGAACALTLAKTDWIVTLRRFCLSVFAWLLPLLLMFSLMWVIALPFTGLAPLFKTGNAAFILLWFIALSVGFANAAYQEGNEAQPYGRRLSRLLEFAWLSLVVLVVIAWLAMKQRIAQYGWTEDRVWATFILVLATVYTLGYAYSLRRRRGWLGNIGNTNIATALVMVAGLALLLSPIADARRIAVKSQMNRLLNGSANSIDYSYLRWQAGRYGLDALKTLAAGIAHKDKALIATKASQALKQKERYSAVDAPNTITLEQMRLRFRVLPQGEVANDALLKTIQTATRWNEQRCLETNAQCFIWMVDLNGDGAKEAVIVQEKPAPWVGNAYFYQALPSGQYQYAGQVNFRKAGDAKRADQVLKDIALGQARVIPPRFNDIEINGQRFSVMEEQK